MLERGSRWPRDLWRQIFSSESLIDGRSVWFRTSFPGFDGIVRPVDSFGGVLDVTDYGAGGNHFQSLAATDCPNGTRIKVNGTNVLCQTVRSRGLVYHAAGGKPTPDASGGW